MLRPVGIDIVLILVILALIALVFIWWWNARVRHIKISEPDYVPPPTPTLARGSEAATDVPLSPPPVPSAPPAAARTAPSASSAGPVSTPLSASVESASASPSPAGATAVASRAPALHDEALGVVSGDDDLQLIKGIGPKIVTLLASQGVTRFGQIAAWTEADVARITPVLGNFASRIDRDQWIDQAKLLAAGDLTGFEQRFGRLER